MKFPKLLIVILFFNYGSFCQSPPPDSLAYTVFLIGDAGEINPKQQAVFKMLKQQIMEAGEKSALIFLGDNLYPHGMPPYYSLDRQGSEAIIDAQLSLVDGYMGAYYFIPGNHDWAQGRSFGWSYLNNQETYVEEKANDGNIFLPDNGCPGPIELALTEDITLIIIDTQWFLHSWNKPNELQGNCVTGNPIEVMQILEDMILKNANKHIIIASHHPMFTYGNHGGFNTVKDHLFPLTELVPFLYIPLPVVGSIYPLFRKIFGNIQDVSHPTYRNMRNSMVNIFEKYPQLIHVAGHEHGLQYSFKDSIHYVVSGSGAKTEYVRTKGFARYTTSSNGFARLDIYKGGEIILELWRLKGKKPEDKPSYDKLLMKKPLQPQMSAGEFQRKVNLEDSSVVTFASGQYGTREKLGKLFLGENYRREWLQKIHVPVFDIGREHGGLEILHQGGGLQTKSLRLQAENGRQYVLRSIEKYPENAVPAFLRETFALDLIHDQISAAHPYGALVIPYLAEAVGIYHTNPELVFIPDDPRLGIYRQTFAGTLALYEERPDEDWSDAPYFGNSENIIGTTTLLEKLAEDNDNQVDQHLTLKSRLFDVIIGDWDRHDDQWRWAEIDKKNGRGNIYRPVPLDRDQAFFVNQGLLPEIVSRRWALPKLEGFDYDVDWAPGFMFNGRYFDRSFLTDLSKPEWAEIARKLKNDLTDKEIEFAIQQWPDSIFRLHGKEIIAKIKSRRDKIVAVALEYYLFLAKRVNVVGSDQHEFFDVHRLDNGDVHVVVSKLNEKGKKEQVIYDRLFNYEETEEIRLYGLGGEDVFVIGGKSKRGIKIRVIGGEDSDQLKDTSHVPGFGRKNIFYDTKSGNVFHLNNESKNKTSESPAVNRYDRRAFNYNVLKPLLTGSIDADDGLSIGGGFRYITHGFRKEPFKDRHEVLIGYAFGSSSSSLKYHGIFTGVLDELNLNITMDIKQPDYVNNFFGLGNESRFNSDTDETIEFDDPIDYYRFHFSEISSAIGFSKKIGGYATLSLLHNFQSVQIKKPEDDQSFIGRYNEATGSINFDKYKSFTGATIDLTFDKRNDLNLPTAGVFWSNSLSFMSAIHNASGSFSAFNSTLAFYYTLRKPSITLVTRFGGGFNLGDYQFYQAQILDGTSELRGYRKTRFYGDSKFYNNTEARYKLFSFRTYIFPSSLGILFFNDVGRVWLQGEKSETWHHSFGGGIWFAPFNKTVLSTELGYSEEDTLFYLRLGFMF